MIARTRFEHLRTTWGQYSSWAVWKARDPRAAPKAGMGDLDVLDPAKNPDLLVMLKPEIVLVALNAATRPLASQAPWVNFHDPRPVANDYKLRFALEGTPYWGAYMTDAFIGVHETSSAKVKLWMNRDPAAVDLHLKRLEAELDDLKATDPLLVALGNITYDVLRPRFGDSYRLVKVPHYARWMGKEAYRAAVLPVLDQAQRGKSL